MNVAILIQCHKNAEQINMLLETMKYPTFTFFIHIDKKSKINEYIIKRDDVVLLPDGLRINVQWGRISQVDATINLLKYAHQYGNFDYYWVCSGQDFPIKHIKEISDWFISHTDNDFIELFESKNNGLSYVNNYDKRNDIYYPTVILGSAYFKRIIKRVYIEITGGYNRTYKWAKRKPINNLPFYFGSSWICLTHTTLVWIFDYLDKHPEYYQFYNHCNCPDESFFHTLVMNSPYATKRKDYLHYVD